MNEGDLALPNEESGPDEDKALLDLVAEVMERRDAGLEPDLAVICATRPDLLEAVRAACDYASAVGLSPAGSGRGAVVESGSEGQLLGGRYRLGDRLGAGAMGVVYRAFDLELSREVAVKLLRPLIVDTVESRTRFEREAEALASLNHPSVVTVHDRGFTESGEAFLVMELLEGLPLSDILDAAELRGERVFVENTDWIGPFLGGGQAPDRSWLRTCALWIAEAASALEATHAASLVHRDVKPSNLFICRSGRVVLLDFGIAADLTAEAITQEGSSLGTPAYMAPEVPESPGRLGPTVDVYGATATLYHLLTLRAPFAGTPSQVLAKLLREDPVPAGRLRKGLPRDLCAILDRGMERRATQRYATSDGLAADLRSFLEHRPVIARPINPAQRLMRRVRRSAAARSAVVTLVLLSVVAAAAAFRSDWLDQRRIDWFDTIAQVSPQLTVATETDRRIADADELAVTRALLDRVVELEDGSSWGLLIRGMFAFDQGDRESAARDLEEAARNEGSDLLGAVASVVASAPDSLLDFAELDLSTLPEPKTPSERMVSAYIALRVRDTAAAVERLASPDLRRFAATPLLQAFCLIAQIEATKDRVQRLSLVDRAQRLLVDFEVRAGETAWSLQMSSYLQLVGRRYRRGLSDAERSFALAPYAYGAALNAAICARRLALYDQALEAVAEAQRMRPSFYKPYWNEIQIRLDMGDLDGAENVLTDAPLGDGELAIWRRLTLDGSIHAERAYRAYLEGDEDSAREAATHAALQFREAKEIRKVDAVARWALSEALATGSEQDLFAWFLRLESGRPYDSRRLQSLLEWMPKDLTENESAMVRRYLTALTRHMTPEAAMRRSDADAAPAGTQQPGEAPR